MSAKIEGEGKIVEVVRSKIQISNTPSGVMVSLPRGEETGFKRDGSQEVGDRSVEAVIQVLSEVGRGGWIDSIQETEPLSPQDCAGMDLLVYFSDRFFLMTGLKSCAIEVKSGVERMDEYMRICCLKGGADANHMDRDQKRKAAFNMMAQEGRVLTCGRWAHATILAHITAQIAEIVRRGTASANPSAELYAGDFYGVLGSLGDTEGQECYDMAATALGDCRFGYYDMYGVEMLSEADLYRQYLVEQETVYDDDGKIDATSPLVHHVFDRQNREVRESTLVEEGGVMELPPIVRQTDRVGVSSSSNGSRYSPVRPKGWWPEVEGEVVASSAKRTNGSRPSRDQNQTRKQTGRASGSTSRKGSNGTSR